MAVAERAAELEREVTRHKAAIRRHRGDLARAKADLVKLQRQCLEHGIGLTITTGEGRPHGRPTDPRP